MQQKAEYILKANYDEVNMYIHPKYKDEVFRDNYQFICEKLMLNSSFLMFIKDIIL